MHRNDDPASRDDQRDRNDGVRGGQPTGAAGWLPLDPVSCRSGDADQWRELKVLTREFHEFHSAVSPFDLVPELRMLHGPERGIALTFPHTVERLEPRRAVVPSGGGER